MKILFISSGLSATYGGAAISESSLAAELSKRCQVKVLCSRSRLDTKFVKEKGNLDCSAFEPLDVLRACVLRNHWLSKAISQSDIVHINGHWRWENYFISGIARRNQIPYVLHPRGMLLVGHRRVWLKRIFNLLLGNFIVKHASAVILLSRFESKHLSSYPCDYRRQVVIPNGIVVPASSTASPFTFPYYLYLGRLEARKNLVFLVDAFAKYRAEGGHAHLVLIGPGERNYDEIIKTTIKGLQIEEFARVLPPVFGPEKTAYLKHAAAVIYPAYDEPFGRVIFEAIAAGSYPIVPDESGGAEYLAPFLKNCIYRHQSLDDLAGKLYFFETSGKGDDLERAKLWLMQELSWATITKRVVSVYSKILNGIDDADSDERSIDFL